MNGKGVLFKSLALVSALAIGGGYVAWRQMEAKKAVAEQAEAKEKGEREKLLREVDEAWQQELELMPGSKNPGRSITRGEIEEILEKRGDFISPITGGSVEASNIETRLLPGSKSMPMPLFTKDNITRDGLLPPMEELDEEIAPEDLLPSSKIGILRLPKKEAEPPEEKKPKLLPGSKSSLVFPVKPETDLPE